MRIRTNFIYSSILTCSNYLSQIITYPYISRILGVERIGICNFVTSYIHYVLLFSTMGISIMGIREVAKCRDNHLELEQCFSSLFILNAISTGVTLFFYFLILFHVQSLSLYRNLLYIGSLQILFNLFMVEWFFKGLEEFKYITYRNLIIRFLYVLCIFLFVRKSSDYLIYFGLLISTIVLNGIINWQYRKRFVHLKWRNIAIKKYLRPFFILGIYILLTSMYTSFNVLYLGFIGGDIEVGYYTTASKIYMVLLGLFSAFTGVMMPRISNLVSKGDYNSIHYLCCQSFNLLFACAVPLIYFCSVFAPQLISLLSGSGYEGAILPMRIIMPLILLIGMEQILIVQLLTPLKQDKVVFINSIVGAIVAIIANLILVHTYFSVGSACVWVLSEFAVFCTAVYFVNKIPQLRRIIPWGALLKNVLWMLPILCLYLFAQYMGYNSFLYLICLAILTISYVMLIQTRIMRNKLFMNLMRTVINKSVVYRNK